MREIDRSLNSVLLNSNQLRNVQGQSLAEYALLLVLIAVVCTGGLQLLGQSVETQLRNMGTGITAAGGAGQSGQSFNTP